MMKIKNFQHAENARHFQAFKYIIILIKKEDEMKVIIKHSYSGKEVPKSIRFVYEKTSKTRPAWIWVENLPKDVMFLSTRINGKIEHYRVYLSTEIPLFLPTTYTREEMRRYYNKFAQIYDKEVESKNLPATKFLLNKIKLQKQSKILDLGAGSGISSIPFVEAGYTDITLLDYSSKMLETAKKKKELKNCKFLCKDIAKLKLKDKFDLIFSLFSFASKSYFDEKEMPNLWKKVVAHLKPNGIFMMLGNDFEPPKSLIKKVKGGWYEMFKGYKTQWYIGKKK